MKTQNWKRILFWVVVCEAVGGLSGWLSREGLQIYMETAKKPPLIAGCT